jgi:hypothetical protein
MSEISCYMGALTKQQSSSKHTGTPWVTLFVASDDA